MSCCTLKKQETSSSIKEFDLLKKHFDIVELEDKGKYRLLTLKDNANRTNYDYVVWLQIKVAYGYTQGHTPRDDNYMLQGVCKSITDWIDILKNFDKSENQSKQLSLFADDNNDEDELEKEPPSPGSDGNWNKYFKDRERVRRNNAMKKYKFFELCDLVNSYYVYQDMDYRQYLPKTNDDLIELVKEAIVKGTSSQKGYGRFDDYWWDDEYNYLCRDGALSDIEIYDRVKHLVRLYLVPYKRDFHVMGDDSYSMHDYEASISHRFWFSGREIEYYGHYDDDKSELPTYTLNTPEFIQWIRDHFNIAYKDVISDEEILKENIKGYFSSLLWHKKDKYDFENKINTFSTWKELKANIISFMKENALDQNGGGSGYSLDGFSGHYSLDKKGEVSVTQNVEFRHSLNRDVEALEINDYNEYIVFKITGDELYKKAFELLNKKQSAISQTSLFDFLLAA